MKQKISHALVREQGITFAVVSVKDDVTYSQQRAAEMIEFLTPIYSCPVVVMGETNRRMFGRTDIVNFLTRIHPARLPWREGYVDFP